MIIEISIPSPGESISEVEIAAWLVNDGDLVEKDQEVAEVESEKATLPLIASESGRISIKIPEKKTTAVGSVACTIDTSVKTTPKPSSGKEAPKEDGEVPEAGPAAIVIKQEPEPAPEDDIKTGKSAQGLKKVRISPVARRMMNEYNLSVEDIINGLQRITSHEVNAVIRGTVAASPSPEAGRSTGRQKMSQLRKKLSQRLVAVKNETAMLTTFNEVDMSEVIRLRREYQKEFTEKHGVKLGFMSFFTKAVTLSLRLFPNLNSMIDGDEIVTHHYCDIGIAVQTDKGLMVPVIRNAESLSMEQLEKQILELANKARSNRISMDDMSGGTFTITNGGLYGSMLSTPLINPPQAAILGMHNIVDRPVALQGRVEIRPVMYLALSYDHRLVDGKDSVIFLKQVKEFIESPVELLFGSRGSDRTLLGI